MYVSTITGEVVDSFTDVIRTAWFDLTRYHFINWHWSRL